MNFSIAMATFNGARFLSAQLESFLHQTLLPSELVACDDGSTDATRDILASFAERAPFPVRVEHNEQRLGVSDNFFKAASLCSQDWIAFSDQDDVWLPEKLETVRATVAGEPGLLLVAHRALIVNDKLEGTGRVLAVPSARRLTIVPARGQRIWHPPLGFTICFDAHLVRDFPYQDRPIVTHDRWIYVLATSIGKVAYLPQPLALYRRHDANVSQFTPPVPLIHGLKDPGNAAEFVEQAEVVEQVARFLDRCPQAGPAASAGPVALASKVYHRQAGMFSARAQLCRPGVRRRERLSCFVRMVWSGAYRVHSRGGLGWRAGLKDAARVFLAR